MFLNMVEATEVELAANAISNYGVILDIYKLFCLDICQHTVYEENVDIPDTFLLSLHL